MEAAVEPPKQIAVSTELPTAPHTPNAQALHVAAQKIADEHPELLAQPGWEKLNAYLNRPQKLVNGTSSSQPRCAARKVAPLGSGRRPTGRARLRRAAILIPLVLLTAQPGLAADINPIRFQSRGVVLSGDVVFPEGRPPIAGLVLVQGANDLKRKLVVAEILASDGFAVLTYDKRGTGQSGGIYWDTPKLAPISPPET